ncbi:hypothetical protein GDO78_013089 [Eleutherodactylus coqui]|uniref:Uncharacterized protein n=1 Tax=Eleutherodactylus coqui TaxID=57060 RepID=A0A8J6EZA2_ELECQ|nr:hypothetical protein GDO78_013089 [Eleutherodactylus coqui]
MVRRSPFLQHRESITGPLSTTSICPNSPMNNILHTDVIYLKINDFSMRMRNYTLHHYPEQHSQFCWLLLKTAGKFMYRHTTKLKGGPILQWER